MSQQLPLEVRGVSSCVLPCVDYIMLHRTVGAEESCTEGKDSTLRLIALDVREGYAAFGVRSKTSPTCLLTISSEFFRVRSKQAGRHACAM